MSFLGSIWNYTQSPKPAADSEAGDVENSGEENSGNVNHEKSSATYNAAYDYGKKFGGLLYNFASNASQQVLTHADKFVEGTVLQDFSQERDKFEEDQKSATSYGLKGDNSLPWSGFEEEDDIKRQILSLSADERNFLRDPPQGIDFHFDLNQNCQAAMALLDADKNLQDMRYALVPKKMKEDVFWRNYFYRVTLITQSAHLKSFAAEDATRRNSVGGDSDQQSSNQSRSVTSEGVMEKSRLVSNTEQDEELQGVGDDFASDAFNAESEQIEQMREEIKNLEEAKESEDGTNATMEDEGLDAIERELEDLDGEFEVVQQNDGSSGSIGDGSGWENEIEQLLESDSHSS